MKYMLLIHRGAAPTPYSDEWERLSEDEQKAVCSTTATRHVPEA